MKKFKKLIALAVVMATFGVTAITTCAATVNGEPHYWRSNLKSSYYLANNTLHYSDFAAGKNNYVFFKNVDKGLMEGNIVFSMDVSNPEATTAKKRYPSTAKASFRNDMSLYLSRLHLMDANDKYICEGKYPLTVQYNNTPRGYINIMLDTNRRVFENVEIHNAVLSYTNEYDYNTTMLNLSCTIYDHHVLPGYILTLEECNSSSPVILSTKASSNRLNTRDVFDIPTGTGATFTFKNFSFNKYKGKTFDVKMNGVYVGQISIKPSSCKAIVTCK